METVHAIHKRVHFHIARTLIVPVVVRCRWLLENLHVDFWNGRHRYLLMEFEEDPEQIHKGTVTSCRSSVYKSICQKCETPAEYVVVRLVVHSHPCSYDAEAPESTRLENRESAGPRDAQSD